MKSNKNTLTMQVHEITIYEALEQRSPEWYKIREGKITASKIIDILGPLTTDKCKKAIDNLAMEKAIEQKFGMIESDFVNFDMQRGIDSEPSAFAMLSDILGIEFIETRKIGFATLGEHIGASPDGLTSNEFNIEIKCPSPKVFFKLVIAKKIDKKHYGQMQHQMLCTNTKSTYYFNYCFHAGREYYFLEIVKRDEEMIELIKERCDIVIKLKLEYMESLNILDIENYGFKGYLATPIESATLIEKL